MRSLRIESFRNNKFTRCFHKGKLVIEIINNTRGGIEGKIGERDDWGANSSPGCSLIHDVPDKKVVLDGFSIFKLFFVVRILKISFQIV